MCGRLGAGNGRFAAQEQKHIYIPVPKNFKMRWQVRVLTNGAVRGAPLTFDALCGHAAPQDPPLLLMFMLMTGMSWRAARLCTSQLHTGWKRV